jgi:4-hydroxy-2-oxoheptanedioate aldolase
MPSFKAKLADPARRMTMHICTIPSAAVTQALAASGADGVIVDMEHGAVDHGSAHAMIAATQGFDCAPLVRIAENRESEVKRALDLGAEGIVFPLVRTAEDARRAVSAMRYPPEGTRGFGPFLAQSRWGTTLPGYRPRITGQLVCCLLIETRDAVDNIEEICAVDGIDLIVPAQFDHPEFIAALDRVEMAARARGIPLGQAALSEEQARGWFARGYRVVAGFDVLWLRQAAAEAQGWCAD